MAEYPRDRFDDVPEYTDRSGGHRAPVDPSARRSRLRWIVLAAAFSLVAGAFSYFVLPTLVDGDAPDPVGAPSPTASAPTTAGAPTESPPGPGAETPAGDEAATSPAQPPGEPTTEPTATAADASVPVEVYNASDVDGRATRAAADLTGAGFTVSATANWEGFPVTFSAVYYSSDQATAQAVASELGLLTVYDERVPGITVVLAR